MPIFGFFVWMQVALAAWVSLSPLFADLLVTFVPGPPLLHLCGFVVWCETWLSRRLGLAAAASLARGGFHVSVRTFLLVS